MRKWLFALCVVALMFAGSCSAFELPQSVDGWQMVKVQTVKLIPEANHEDLGRMVYADYERESPKGFLQVILCEGTGTGSLYVPKEINTSKGVMPSESEYKTLKVGLCDAVLERVSNMPLVIAVNAGDNVILTIESGSLDETGLVRFAEEVLSQWRDTGSDLYPAP